MASDRAYHLSPQLILEPKSGLITSYSGHTKP